MSKLIPHLWFDKEGKEAADFYIDIFENSKILRTVTLKDTPSGDSQVISFQLAGQAFEAINGSPFLSLILQYPLW